MNYSMIVACILLMLPLLPLPAFCPTVEEAAEPEYHRGYGPVVINEFMYDPSDGLGDDEDFEWIELYNFSDTKVSLESWSINGIRLDGVIRENDFFVVARQDTSDPDDDGDYFSAHYNRENGYKIFSPVFDARGQNLGLRNEEGRILLCDAEGEYVDRVVYDRSMGADGNGSSLEKFVSFEPPDLVDVVPGEPEILLTSPGGDFRLFVPDSASESKGDNARWGESRPGWRFGSPTTRNSYFPVRMKVELNGAEFCPGDTFHVNTRFVNNYPGDIEFGIWRALATRSGRELIRSRKDRIFLEAGETLSLENEWIVPLLLPPGAYIYKEIIGRSEDSAAPEVEEFSVSSQDDPLPDFTSNPLF